MVSCFNPRDYLRFRATRKFTAIDLTYNTIGVTGACHLAKAIKTDPYIKILHLSGNKIGNKGTEAIADAIQNNQNIRELRLGDNEIGDSGIIAIARAIRENKSLRVLYLDHNMITDIAAKELAFCLANNENCGVTNICLYGNQISDEGACAFSLVIRRCKSLVSLDFGKNQISDKGSLALARSFRDYGHFSSLYRLNIAENAINVLPAEFAQGEQMIPNLSYDNNSNMYIPPNLRRSLRYIHLYNWKKKKSKEDLGQNSSSLEKFNKETTNSCKVQLGLMDSVSKVLNERPMYKNFEEIRKVILNDTILSEHCKSLLLQYSQKNDIHEVLNVSFRELLPSVLSRINRHPSQDEIKRSLNREIEDGLCKFVIGRIVCLISCLLKYDKDVVFEDSLVRKIMKSKNIPTELDSQIYEYLTAKDLEGLI